MSQKAKILLLDIETFPNVGFIWSLWDKFIPIDRIVEPGYTLCWAAKWVGQREVMFSSVWDDGPHDMIMNMFDLLEEADIVITYNGDKFDLPTLNREFLDLSLPQPASYKSLDLYKTVRKQFRLVSNKLDYVCQHLGLGAKTQHKGMALWAGCAEGNEKDQRVMKRYNIQDVRLLEKLYKRLLPWIKQHPNMALYFDPKRPVCHACGSSHLQKRGFASTNTMTYQRYQCQSCGSWSRERTNNVPKEKKANILTRVV